MGHRGPARLSCQSPWGAGPQPAAGNAAPPAGRRAARRARPEPAPGALLAHHPATPAGVVGRIGGPPPGGAAPPPHLGSGRPGSGLWPGLNKISLFCTPEGPWPGGPQLTTRTLLARPGHGPGGLANCGVAGLCIQHSPDGVPAIIQNNLFCSDRARHGQRPNLWRRRSFDWRNARPPGTASGAPLALGRGAGGSGELTRSTTQPPPPEWRAATSGPPPGGAGPGWAEERPEGPGRSQSPGSGAWGGGRPKGPGRSQQAPGSPLWGAGGGSPGRLLDNRTECHQGHPGSGSTHRGGLRYAPGTEARCGPL